MKTTIIYALYKDYTPFYVGKTKNWDTRFEDHKRKYGQDIIMKKLDIIPSVKVEDWKPYETAWISFYKVWNEATLVNKNKGGGGPSFHTDEVKDKISKTKTGKTTAKKGIKIGSCPKISEALAGKPRSLEARTNMSKARKGKKRPQICKPILQYDLQGNFIQEWPSQTEASKALNIKQRPIGAVCLNRQKTAYGFIWKFKN